ncbi:MAG: hypothetical protein CVU48_09955 [Candidatus Cloacimonetes bacterium HGW-Cloacimonetes-1]|jgi:hypothetical protein|nr:MAG: hypothetical protein CVU48_09955 [Candidatus Cloacimonetes bacterium HGW-Cloacimonetes-1]
MKRISSLIPLISILVLLLVSFATSCDKRNPPVVIPPVPQPTPLSLQRYITKMVASPDTIYADMNITYSEISVTVKDGDGIAVPDQIVQFKTSKGKILGNVATDGSGIATSTFYDDGDQGLAVIEAIVKNFADSDSLISIARDSLYVMIEDVPPIQSIQMQISGDNITLPAYGTSVMQSTTVTAIPKNIFGNDVPDNTLVTFIVTTGAGYFIDAEGNITGETAISRTLNGRAVITYNAGPNASSGTITARLADKISSRNVVIKHGNPASIALKTFVQVGTELIEADTSNVNSVNHIYLQATLKDAFNNSCQSIRVSFGTNLGTFTNTTQSAAVNTGDGGVAQVRFTPGLQAGEALLTASANNDTLQVSKAFTIYSDQIHSITFTQTGQIDLNVANTGGTSSAILRVKLKDINANLIDRPHQVYFRILNATPPAGANLNNMGVGPVVVTSSGGEAQVSVNSGSESGVLTIKAWVFVDGDPTNTAATNLVYANKPNIIIHSGPANTIVPFIGNFNTGVNIGGGLWRVIAGAIVKDINGNPVDNYTSVWFDLPDNPYNCQIGASGYTGNVSVNGDSLAGVAFTTLIYSGVYTFETLSIRARTGDENGNEVSGIAQVILPLNEPRLEIQVVPGHLDFGEAAPAFREAMVYATLTDAQGNPVRDAYLMMTSSRGQWIYTPGSDPIVYPNPPATPHIIRTDIWGNAQGKIKCFLLEIPLPDPQTQTPGMTNVEITARILGTNTFAQTALVLYRYVGAGPGK